MRTVYRTPTARGAIVRFRPCGPLPTPDTPWPHKGEVPGLTTSAKGAHVTKLVCAMNEWWDACHGRTSATAEVAGEA